MITLEQVAYGHGADALFAGLDLTLEAGAFHVVTGPPGTGKSRVLQMCHGALRPSAGRVRLFGDHSATLSRDALAQLRRRIGMVPERPDFLSHLSVAENIALPLAATGAARLGAATSGADLHDLLGWMGLSRYADAAPGALSAGAAMRAALARALVLSPEVILADLSTAPLRPDAAARMVGLLADLHEMGTSVLLATPEAALVEIAQTRAGAEVTVLGAAPPEPEPEPSPHPEDTA